MKQPKIRFKGFEGEWDYLSFKQAFSFLKNNSLSRAELDFNNGCVKNVHYGDVLIKYGELLNLSQEEVPYIKESTSATKISSDSQLRNGDIIFADAAEDNTVGKCTEIRGIGKSEKIVSGLHTIPCRPYYSFEDGYLGYYLNSSCYHDQLLPHIQGTKISSISKKALTSTHLLFSNNLKEQKAIADYFKSLDSLIQTTTKKIASLKQMKSACLVSMFPQEGETKPRVRFKGFEGEWKKDKAINLFETFNIRNRPDLPVLSANQDIRGMAPRTESGYNISHDRANEVTYKVVKPGQFVIHLRSFQGGFAHSSVEGITSPAYTVFGLKDERNHDDYFWKIIFMSKTFVKRLETITYGIRDGRSISFGEFSEMPFLFPCCEEQQKIASFFSTLDAQISIQEQRLEKLKQIKSACLDKMFV